MYCDHRFSFMEDCSQAVETSHEFLHVKLLNDLLLHPSLFQLSVQIEYYVMSLTLPRGYRFLLGRRAFAEQHVY